MKEKKLSSEVQFALMQIEHEKKVIQAFLENPNENVASVCLEVGGVEHTILIHNEDYAKLCSLLMEFNHAEHGRVTGCGNAMSMEGNMQDEGKIIAMKLGCVVKLWTVKHSPNSLVKLWNTLERIKDDLQGVGRHDDAAHVYDIASLVELVWGQLTMLNLNGHKWGKEESV